MTEALTGIDRSALLAERAEAEAQLRAAEATLGIAGAPSNGRAATGEEPGKSTPNPHAMDDEQAGPSTPFDVAALRRAAASARAADDVLARAASEAAERPLAHEALSGSGANQLGSAEAALARALEIRDDLPAAWRRLVGALISATGMAIVIGALGWNVYWLLVPIALIAIMTVDLRVAGKAAREASVVAARELASVGVAGAGGLDRMRLERTRIDEAETRLAAARTDRDTAYARFEALAPGRLPSEVEEIIAEYEEELAAQAEVAPPPTEPAPELPEPVTEPAEAAPEPEPTVDWWFKPEGSVPVAPPEQTPAAAPAAIPTPAATPEPPPAPAPAAPSAPVRALAERLSAEGREALARIEAQLAALDRVELAKRSLEWHEARSAAESPEGPPAPEKG